MDVNTTRLRGLNNAPLLGPNREVVNQNRGFQGFNSQIAQDFIEDRDPVVIRFPQGVFANSYLDTGIVNCLVELLTEFVYQILFCRISHHQFFSLV